MKWKLVPVEPTPDMIDTGYFVIATSHTGANAAKKAYSAMLEEAPQPPKLSDERILELWASNSGRPVTMGKARIIAQARSIEREILGGEA